MDGKLRPELPLLPERIAKLPVDERGYPVPWFAAWMDDDGQPVERGEGKPDFRVIYPGAATTAWRRGLCWICGEPLGAYKTFVLGPMCAVNRTSAEPPSHRDCADWSARACPFLTRPHARRRDAQMPEGTVEGPGIMLRRNPGVALVWTTKKPSVFPDPGGGMLFNIGDPDNVRWYAEGRVATRDEVMESINSGLPSLRELAEQERGGVRALDKAVSRAMKVVPT